MLSEADLRIAHALQEAPRAPWSTLASALGTDARTLIRRYEQLREAGHIRVTSTLGPRLLERVYWAHLRIRTLPGQALQAARQVAAWPQAGLVRVADGAFEVYALLMGRDAAAPWHDAQEGIAHIREIVQADVYTIVEALDIGLSERLDVLSRSELGKLRTPRDPATTTLVDSTRAKDFDLELWHQLNLDGRADITTLADRLARSPSTVSRRITRLQTAGYLDFLTMIADPVAPRSRSVFLWCRIADDELPALRSRHSSLHWIGLLTIMTGRSNVMLLANVTSMAALDTVLSELRSICPSLEVHETQLSTLAVKRHTRLMTDDERWTDEVITVYPDLRRWVED
ncbi:Lrp/AsnC family transcriptional regulator [Microbacterium sp. NPDC077644]|uniref:Lrp/AsnC family transcriptional regulator n=1 Tax=Microbacterium sp. NPDC077644 TaxID=3155055 RepID=UPI0034505FF9